MGRRLFVRLAAAGLLVLSVCFTVGFADTTGSGKPGKSALTEEQQQSNLDSFEYVWKTVRDKHWDPKLNGLDWEAVRKELRPRVEKANSMAEARAAMSEMLQKLGQSHFAIIPRDVYQVLDKTSDSKEKKSKKDDFPTGEGTAGVEVRVVDGQALITKVDEQSPAAKAGVKPGLVLHKVRNQEVGPMLERAIKQFKDSSYLDLRLSRAVEARLSGRPGEKVPMVFRDGEDKELPLEVPLMLPKGRIAGLGHMPGGYVRLEARRLEDNVGYIALNAFFDPPRIMKEFEKAVWNKPLADGIIIDLRGNPGGLGAMAMGMSNWFIDRPNLKLGSMITRVAPMHFILNPQAETYKGPLAVLVDGCSASTSEIMAGGLQGIKRARVFGTRTAGAALPSVIERLPNGDAFQFAIANYISADGKVLEGNGVVPDEEVKPDRKILLAGRDPVIDAASQWIKKQPKP